MPDISAKTPVTVPGSSEIVYDKWYLTQLNVKADPNKAMTQVRLTRSGTSDGKTVLMDKDPSGNATVSFNLDIFKEMGEHPALAAAFNAVLTAVQEYATAKNLL